MASHISRKKNQKNLQSLVQEIPIGILGITHSFSQDLIKLIIITFVTQKARCLIWNQAAAGDSHQL